MDALLINEATDLMAHWGEHPPMHISVAAIARALGAMSSSSPEGMRYSTEDEIRNLMGELSPR